MTNPQQIELLEFVQKQDPVVIALCVHVVLTRIHNRPPLFLIHWLENR